MSLFLLESMLRMVPVPTKAMGEQWHELQHETDFYPGSYCPKVQMPYVCPPGHVPRKIEIERWAVQINILHNCFSTGGSQHKSLRSVFISKFNASKDNSYFKLMLFFFFTFYSLKNPEKNMVSIKKKCFSTFIFYCYFLEYTKDT